MEWEVIQFYFGQNRENQIGVTINDEAFHVGDQNIKNGLLQNYELKIVSKSEYILWTQFHDFCLRQLLNLLYNPRAHPFIMTESSPLKLHPINKCFNLDHVIHRFINDKQSNNESPNFFYSPPKKPMGSKKKTSFKSSLSDWRSLYGQSQRPKTHSLISYPKTQRFLEKKFSNPQHPNKPKTSYNLTGNSARFTNRNKLPNPSLTNRSIGKNIGVMNPEYSKTTFSFYEGSMRDELQVYGKLTNEYKNATQTNFKINKKKSNKRKMDELYP